MRQINEKKPTGPFDWELALFSCKTCGRMWRFDSKEEADDSFEMWGMGAFAYFKDCPICKTHMAIEVPFFPHEETLFRYVYELEQKIERLGGTN